MTSTIGHLITRQSPSGAAGASSDLMRKVFSTPEDDVDSLDQAVAAAASAQPSWAVASCETPSGIFYQIARSLRERKASSQSISTSAPRPTLRHPKMGRP